MSRYAASLLALCLAVPAVAADWPQWMGPSRDGVWTEAGVADKFPAGGPKKLWEEAAGGGYSGPAVAGGKVFVFDYLLMSGEVENDPAKRDELTGHERVRCLDAKTGKELWKHCYPCPYRVSYGCGPRCTPTVDGDRVYTLGAMGNLTCIDTATGKPMWKTDFVGDLKATVPVWGFSGHPLVHRNAVICTVGEAAGVVAFDKLTGKELWTALPDIAAGYSPPTLTTVGDKRQLLIWHPKELVALDPETGKHLWDVKLEPKYGMSIAAPQRSRDFLFAAGAGERGLMLKFEPGQAKPKELWHGHRDLGLYPTNGTPLIDGDTMYGCDCMTGGLRAVNVATGKRLWEAFEPTTGKDTAKHGTAFLVRNGGRFFLFSETGELVVAKLTPEKYEEIGRAKLVEPTGTAFGRPVVWSHPAFADKCVFVRNDKVVACYDLSAK